MADSQAVKAMERFEMESGLPGFWTVEVRAGGDDFRYFRKIIVEPAYEIK